MTRFLSLTNSITALVAASKNDRKNEQDVTKKYIIFGQSHAERPSSCCLATT